MLKSKDRTNTFNSGSSKSLKDKKVLSRSSLGRNHLLKKDDSANVVDHINREDLVVLLKRARGQLDGIIERLEKGNFEPEALNIQFSAVVAALQKAKVRYVEEMVKARILLNLSGLSKLI